MSTAQELEPAPNKPSYVASNWDEGYYAERKALIDHVGLLVTDLAVISSESGDATVVYHGWSDVADDVVFTWQDPAGSVTTRSVSLGEGQFVQEFPLTGVSASSADALLSLESTPNSGIEWATLRDAIRLTFTSPANVDYVPPPWEPARWLYTVGTVAIEAEACMLPCDLDPGGTSSLLTAPMSVSANSTTQDEITRESTNSANSTSGGGFSTMSSHCSNCVGVVGQIWNKHDDGFYAFCQYCRVEVWESDGANNPDRHEQLSDVTTGASFVYTSDIGVFEMWVDPYDANGGIDPYVAVDLWDRPSERISMRAPVEIGTDRLEEADAEYYYRHGKAQRTNCVPGTTCDLGNIDISSDMNVADGITSDGKMRLGQVSPNWETAAQARDAMLEHSERLDGATGYNPSQVQVAVPAEDSPYACGHDGANSKTAVFYRSCNGVTAILMGSFAAENEFTVAHEYGHHVMWQAYGESNWPNPPPPQDCPLRHPRGDASPVECAWKEGWAEFYALVANRNPVRLYHDGSEIRFDCFEGDGQTPRVWDHDGNPSEGQTVEGRITAALWDFIDGSPCPGYSTDDDGVDRNTKAAVWGPLASGSNPSNFDSYHTVVHGQWSAWGNDLRTAAAHNGVTV